MSQSQQLLLPPKSPLEEVPQPLLPFPHPPQKNRSRMIQTQLPQPLLFRLPVHPQESLHPQFVAVKSLIVMPPKVYLCFIV